MLFRVKLIIDQSVTMFENPNLPEGVIKEIKKGLKKFPKGLKDGEKPMTVNLTVNYGAVEEKILTNALLSNKSVFKVEAFFAKVYLAIAKAHQD